MYSFLIIFFRWLGFYAIILLARLIYLLDNFKKFPTVDFIQRYYLLEWLAVTLILTIRTWWRGFRIVQKIKKYISVGTVGDWEIVDEKGKIKACGILGEYDRLYTTLAFLSFGPYWVKIMVGNEVFVERC